MHSFESLSVLELQSSDFAFLTFRYAGPMSSFVYLDCKNTNNNLN